MPAAGPRESRRSRRKATTTITKVFVPALVLVCVTVMALPRAQALSDLEALLRQAGTLYDNGEYEDALAGFTRARESPDAGIALEKAPAAPATVEPMLRPKSLPDQLLPVRQRG